MAKNNADKKKQIELVEPTPEELSEFAYLPHLKLPA